MDAASVARALGDPILHPLSNEALLSLGSMEGLAEAPARKQPSPWPGYIAAALVAAAAYALHTLPVARQAGVSILAIVLAVVARNLLPVPASTIAGCKLIVRRVIPAAIVLIGAQLNLLTMASIGAPTFAILLVTMSIAFGSAWLAGRLLGIRPRTALLIGAGTAICGNTAIIAASPIIEADDEDVAVSIGTVSLLGLVLMFVMPLAGGLMAMPQLAFGIWTGAAIHAVPQVVAAGLSYGNEAGTVATLTKLVRVSLLAPLMLLLAIGYARHWKQEGRSPARRASFRLSQAFPGFLWGFFILAALATAELIPVLEFRFGRVPLTAVFSEAGNLCLTLAMAAIGLELNFRLLANLGRRALGAGIIAAAALCTTSWLLIRYFL